MKSRINLYTSDFAPTVSLVSLNSLAALMLLLIVFSVSVSALLSWRAGALTEQRDVLRNQLDALQKNVDAAQKQIAERKPDPRLVNEIEVKKLSLAARERVLKELASKEEIKTNRFSQVMNDLDSADTPQVWLTRIVFDNGHIALEGYGTKADAMPIWLGQLSATESFAGVALQQMSIQKQEQGLFFSLSTDANASAVRGQN